MKLNIRIEILLYNKILFNYVPNQEVGILSSELLEKLKKIGPGLFQDSKSIKDRLNELKLRQHVDLRNWAKLQDEKFSYWGFISNLSELENFS